ncbi:hypothetical protein HU200_004326 [Digitaria exilis]|uniref:Uncharacterized protein n=1 Tax=Digitaria exilis TaxID=1010633 RepID=A0A835KTW5_9POAL|nr:hypothetical protein HU200_004326 [Digitaria exilis]
MPMLYHQEPNTSPASTPPSKNLIAGRSMPPPILPPAPAPSQLGMLERFIFRRTTPKPFARQEDHGDRRDLRRRWLPPPTPSRLYLSWPGGPKRERILVLLRLDSFVDPSNTSPFGEYSVLRRVPSYTKYNAHYERARTFPFDYFVVLRSIVSDDSAGGGEKWEVKRVSFIKFPRNIRCHSALRSELGFTIR